jgi:hypothetical protein
MARSTRGLPMPSLCQEWSFGAPLASFGVRRSRRRLVERVKSRSAAAVAVPAAHSDFTRRRSNLHWLQRGCRCSDYERVLSFKAFLANGFEAALYCARLPKVGTSAHRTTLIRPALHCGRGDAINTVGTRARPSPMTEPCPHTPRPLLRLQLSQSN